MNKKNREIHTFFNPQSIALIGVSRSFGFGGSLTKFFIEHGWQDNLYPVNPKVAEIEGIRAYPAITDVPATVDLACILVAAPHVEKVLEQCIAKGVKAVIIMSAGFAETGTQGKAAQDALAAKARQAGVRVIGPNCLGVINIHRGLATCEILLDEIEPGNISIVAQSGTFGNVLVDGFPSQGIRLAKVATIGNRADLDETDFLEYLAADEETRVIVLYLESIRRGRDFLKAARAAARRKPILACLGGQTEAGRQATQSHTGSLAGFGALDKAVLRQAGICLADDPLELLEAAKVFSMNPLPRGDRVLVITASGSLGVMAADSISREGLQLAPLSSACCSRIEAIAPGWMNVRNPLDIGPSGLFRQAMDIVLEEDGVDAFIIFPVIPWVVAAPLIKDAPEQLEALFADRSRLEAAIKTRPIIISAPGHPGWKDACAGLFGPEVPFVSTPQTAVRALAAYYRYGQWRQGRG